MSHLKENDFVFDRVEGGEYCDYWFSVIGKTQAELTARYMEQSMIEVSEVVFSIQDGYWGIKRLFPFSFDVITPSGDKELYEILKSVAYKAFHKLNMNSGFANWKIENEDGLSFEKIVKLYPVEHHYEQPGEKPYIKYGCPVCEMCGLKQQVHPSDTRCPNCGVNLLWEWKKGDL